MNKYKQKNDIPESNRFFDTNQDNIVIQQSLCREYFRLVYTEGKNSAWVMLKNNTGIKTLRDGHYVYYRPNLVIKFFITHN